MPRRFVRLTGIACAILTALSVLAQGLAQSPQVPRVDFALVPGALIEGKSIQAVSIANYGPTDAVLDRVKLTGSNQLFKLLGPGDSVQPTITLAAGEVTIVRFQPCFAETDCAQPGGSEIVADIFEPGTRGQFEFRIVPGAAGAATSTVLLRTFSFPPDLPSMYKWGLILAIIAAVVACWMTGIYWGSHERAKKSDGTFLSAGPVSVRGSWTALYSSIVGVGSTAVIPLLGGLLGSSASGAMDPFVFWGALFALPYLIAPAVVITRRPTREVLEALLGAGEIDPKVEYRLVDFRTYLVAQFLALLSTFAFTGLAGAWLHRGYLQLGFPAGGQDVVPWVLVALVWVVGVQFAFRRMKELIDFALWRPKVLPPLSENLVPVARAVGGEPQLQATFV